MSDPYEFRQSPNRCVSINTVRTTLLLRFGLVVAIMVGLNFFRLWVTWRAWGTDGVEQIGFPFVFFERGGFSYHEKWHHELLAIDVAIGLAAAYWMTYIFRDGLFVTFRGLHYQDEHADCPMKSSDIAKEHIKD